MSRRVRSTMEVLEVASIEVFSTLHCHYKDYLSEYVCMDVYKLEYHLNAPVSRIQPHIVEGIGVVA